EFDKNIVEGGNLNAQYKKYRQSFEDKFNSRIKPLQDSIRSLYKNDEYHSDRAKLLYTELKELKNQDEKVVVYNKIDDLNKAGQNLSTKAKVQEDKLKL